MQIKTKISIISIIFVCSFFAVSCGSSSKEEPENDTDTETTDADETDDSEDESYNASVSSIKFTIPEESSLVAESSGHLAFPDVVKLQNGKLMTVFRSGKDHAEKSGSIIVAFSKDGVEWDDSDYLMNDSTIDDRDPSITVFSDGRVGMNWFKYRYADDHNEPWVHHLFFAVSDQSGLNFSEPVQVDPGIFDYSETAVLDENGVWLDEKGEEITVAASSSSAIEHEGKIIIPGYFGGALNWSSMGSTPKTRVVLFESADGGATWTPNKVEAEIDDKIWLSEPALLKVTEKRWLLHVRTAKGASPSNKGDLMQSISEDGGKTWSPYESLGFVAHAPELLKLNNGVLVSSFRWLDYVGSNPKSESVSMIYSLDGGATWSDLIEILDCGAAECGYPGMVELDGNKILVVYYTPGGKTIESKIITFEAE